MGNSNMLAPSHYAIRRVNINVIFLHFCQLTVPSSHVSQGDKLSLTTTSSQDFYFKHMVLVLYVLVVSSFVDVKLEKKVDSTRIRLEKNGVFWIESFMCKYIHYYILLATRLVKGQSMDGPLVCVPIQHPNFPSVNVMNQDYIPK